MSWSDPIADMLTRIRNAQKANLPHVDVPGSRIKTEIARVMKAEGYITDYPVAGAAPNTPRLVLKYSGGETQ